MTEPASGRCKVSFFNVFVNDSDNVLAFNCMTGALALLEASEASGLREGRPVDSQLLSGLLDGGFLEPTPNAHLGELHDSYLAWARDDSTLSLTLAPTLACNFACTYCFQKGLAPGQTMSRITEKHVLQFVRSLLPGKRRLSVVWYGGEPLLGWKAMERLTNGFLEVCKRHGAQYDAAMVTNGYLLTEEKASRLLDLHIRKIQVTLDGLTSIHDTRRPTKKSEPTFGRILDNLLTVGAIEEVKTVIRVNVDGDNGAEARELLNFLALRGFAGRNNVAVSFSPVKNSSDVGDSDCTVDAGFAQWQTSLCREAEELGLASPWRPRRRSGSCGAVHPHTFVIGPNGAIYKCWEIIGRPEGVVGHVAEPWNVSQNDWLGFDPFSGACGRCNLLPLCVGGCPLSRIRSHSQTPDESWCHLVRSGLEQWMLSFGHRETIKCAS